MDRGSYLAEPEEHRHRLRSQVGEIEPVRLAEDAADGVQLVHQRVEQDALIDLTGKIVSRSDGLSHCCLRTPPQRFGLLGRDRGRWREILVLEIRRER